MERIELRRLAGIACFALLAACTTPADVGEECVDNSDCMDGLSCFEHEDAEPSPICMRDCPVDGPRLCADGSVCTPARAGTPGRDPNLGVCYVGGAVPVGGACSANPSANPPDNGLDCVRGAICVDVGGNLACYRACRVDDTSAACPAGETCAPLEAMGTNGFCRAEGG